MLKLNFIGQFNSLFKFDKKNNQFTVGFRNFYLFIYFIKKFLFYKDIFIKFSFFKKKKTPHVFLKSYFKYKISKHKLFEHDNKFFIKINLDLNYKLYYHHYFEIYKIFFFFKKNNLFSSPLYYINRCKINYVFINNNFNFI